MLNTEIKSLLKKNWQIFVLAGLTIVFFLKILAGFNFLTNDLLYLHLPVKEYLFSRLQNFHLPLWDPYTLSGRPFLADPQTGIFNPLNLLILPFWKTGPPASEAGNLDWNFWLLEIQSIASIFLGGVFIYWLMKYYRIGLAGRLISSLIFMFAGFNVSRLIHPNIIQTVIWLPLIFLFYQRTLRERKTKLAVLTGVFLALAILAGHPQMSYYLFLFLGIYFLFFLFLRAKGKQFFRLGTLSLIVILVSLGLSSLQLIPSLELAQGSQRMESGYSLFEFASSYSLPPVHWLIASFLPHFFPNTGAGSKLLDIYACCPWEYASYLGAFTLVFIILGLCVKGKEKWFLFFVFILSLIISFGKFTPLYHLLYRFLPGFNLFRVPARFLFFVQFAGAVLAGFGLNYFLKNRLVAKRILKWGLTGFLILIILLIYFISFQSQPFFSWLKWPKIVRQDFLIFSLSFLAGISVLSLGLVSKKLQKIGGFGLIVILFFELMLISQNFRFIYSRYPASQIYPSWPELTFLKNKNLADYRLLSRPALQLNAGLIEQLPTLEGWQSLVNSRYNRLLEIDFLYPSAEINIQKNKKIIDLLNARYLIWRRGNELKIIENYEALPRAFFSAQAEKLPTEEILTKIKKLDYDPRQIIYLEESPTNYQSNTNIQITNNIEKNRKFLPGNNVKIVQYQPEKIVLQTDLKNNGWLFLSETFYPGWQVFVDGHQEKIYRANYFFRTIPVSSGIHQVEFVFKPKSLKIGLVISLFTFLVISFVLIRKTNHLNNFDKKIF